MNWKVELTAEAIEDFNRLDGSVKKLVLKQLVKLELGPDYGEPLGNKAGINLEGYFKLYADKKRSGFGLFIGLAIIPFESLLSINGKIWKFIASH